MNDEPSAVKALVAAFLHENDEVCIISMATNSRYIISCPTIAGSIHSDSSSLSLPAPRETSDESRSL